MTEHTNDLDAIEARAKAATPGPWEARTGGDNYPWVALYDDEAKIPERESLPSFEPAGTATSADAEHIAGMDPVATLALVAEVRELRAKVARVEAVRACIVNNTAMVTEGPYVGRLKVYDMLDRALSGESA